MLRFKELTEKNLILYAAKHYSNPKFSDIDDFNEDLKRFKYIKRLLRKYDETKILKERLLLNHFIVLKNVFGTDACATLLLFKIQREYWSIMKSFLLYLNIITEEELKDVDRDENVHQILEKL